MLAGPAGAAYNRQRLRFLRVFNFLNQCSLSQGLEYRSPGVIISR